MKLYRCDFTSKQDTALGCIQKNYDGMLANKKIKTSKDKS